MSEESQGVGPTESVSPTADREIRVSRNLRAPRELVFQAWTDPKHMTKWWGPNGFTITTEEIDVRPGGRWRFIMHGPDGTDYPNLILYLELVRPERIVYDHGPIPTFRVTVTLVAQGDRTHLTVHKIFESAAARDMVVREFGALEGLHQHLDHLEAALAKLQEST